MLLQSIGGTLGSDVSDVNFLVSMLVLRLLQTTADGWRFIGGTPEKGELLTPFGVVSLQGILRKEKS